jgi:hypothetical protein
MIHTGVAFDAATFGTYSLDDSEVRCVELVKVSDNTIMELDKLERDVVTSFLNAAGRNPSDNGAKRNHLMTSIIESNRLLETKKLTATASRIMVVVTDGETSVPNFDGAVDKILPSLIDNKIAVYVVLIGKSTTPEASAVKVENSLVLRKLAEETPNGRYLEAETLPECFSIFASAPGLTVTPRATRINFQLAPECVIPCTYFGKISKMTLPTLKKYSKPQPAASGAGGRGRGAAADDGDDDFVPGGSGPAKRDTTYRNPDDPDEIINVEDRVKGYKYGSQYIPISGTEEEAFKIEGPAVIELVGFLSVDAIPRHHFMEPTSIVQGDTSSASNGLTAAVAIAALSMGMRVENKVALVRFVKKENSDPSMGLLIPSDKHDATLLLNRLPFVEDYRDFSFPSLPTSKGADNTVVSAAQFATMGNFIDSITINEPNPLQTNPFNPALKLLVDTVGGKLREIKSDADKVLKVRGTTYELSSTFLKSCNPMAPVEIKAEDGEQTDPLQKVLAAFPLRKRDEKEDKKKTYWSDIRIQSNDNARINRDGTVEVRCLTRDAAVRNQYMCTPNQITIAPEYGNGSTKRARTDASQTASQEISEDTYAGPTISAGSVTPVDDFQAVVDYGIANGSDTLVIQTAAKNAMVTIEEIISMMVTRGGTQAHYRKAVACLKVRQYILCYSFCWYYFIVLLQAYRRGAVLFRQSKRYNDFLRDSIKYQFSAGKHAGFWKLLLAEPVPEVSLISSSEDESSDVSHDSAMVFMSEDIKVAPVAMNVAPVETEEDLFGEMA